MLAWCTSVIPWYPFPLFLWYNVHYHLQMSSGYLFPTTPSNLLCKENMTSALSPATSVPLSCFVFPTTHTPFRRTTYFTCSHDLFVVWLFHWNVRSLRVRIYVCFAPISRATGIVLAKDPIKCQHESLGAYKNWGQERSVVAPLGECFPFQGWGW